MNTHKVTTLSLMTTLALALSYLESLIPVPFPVPGAKLGLPNIVTVYLLYRLNFKDALFVLVLRIFLAGFLFGSMSSIIYALSGALLSILVMQLCISQNIGVLLTSILGGISHNMGQLIMACLVTQTPSLFIAYSGILFLIGALTGLFIGLCSKMLLKAKIDN